MTARYRYQFADLLTDAPRGELELSGVSFDRRIIQAGSFSATAHVPSRAVAEKVRRVIPTSPEEVQTGPGRTAVHITRNSALWGTYVLWRGEPQSDERGRITVPLQGASLESYLHHREIRANLTYTAQDQTSGIAGPLITHMQAVASGDIGLTVNAPASGNDPRDRTYRRSEAATYGQRLEELANVIDGFEYMIRTYLDGSARVREFVTGYPQLGLTAPEADWAFEKPGNIVSWAYPSDATSAATSYQARGDTLQSDVTNSEPLMSDEAHATALLAAGWPRLDRTIDHSSVILKPTLDDYAEWWAATRPGVIRVPQVTVRLPETTPVDPNQLGRYAKLKIVDHWFPLNASGEPTFSNRWRVVGMEVTPVSRESGQEQVRLIFAEEAAA